VAISDIGILLRRAVGRYHPDPHGGLSFFFEKARRDGHGIELRKRWQEIPLIADLRPDDAVLDIGCAEGLVAIEAARLVRQVDGIEYLEHRVAAARRFAAEAGVANVAFAAGSIVDDELPSRAWDVVFFLGMYGYPAGSGAIGNAELGKALEAARRQIVVRVDVQDHPDGLRHLPEILACFDAHGFDGICFPKISLDVGNIIIGNRRGADARLRYLPPLVLLPSHAARDLPILRDQAIPEGDPGVWGGMLGHYPDGRKG
jgi:SAM-dependent methyltransferase